MECQGRVLDAAQIFTNPSWVWYIHSSQLKAFESMIFFQFSNGFLGESQEDLKNGETLEFLQNMLFSNCWSQSWLVPRIFLLHVVLRSYLLSSKPGALNVT